MIHIHVKIYTINYFFHTSNIKIQLDWTLLQQVSATLTVTIRLKAYLSVLRAEHHDFVAVTLCQLELG